MKLSYAICVCNESKDLYSLISFLKKVKDPEDEINVLVDSAHVTPQVRSVLGHFKDDIVQNDREFDGNFSTHRNYQFELCKGDYIFYIDPDEMPQENLIKNIKQIIKDTKTELILIPRINICPGYTQEWLSKTTLQVNDMGWLNWPDVQGRIFKNEPTRIKMTNELHENVTGSTSYIRLEPNPNNALWHIKSIEKQYNRWEKGQYISPSGKDFYDSLM
jgi:glycosyltransferase involved in cell wall biosynthesis